MLKFLHHLFNPHCEQCELDLRELDRCKSCETLQSALDQANREKHDLLNTILRLSSGTKQVEDKPYEPNLEEVKPRQVPWRVRQAQLEAEDRRSAQILKDKQKEIDDTKVAAKFTVKVETTPSVTDAIDELEEEVLGDLQNAK